MRIGALWFLLVFSLVASKGWAIDAKELQDIVAAHPQVNACPILFVVRMQYAGDHHNTATMFQANEINAYKYAGGGAFKILDLAKGGVVRTLFDAGPEGMVRDPELSFDGRRILFSMRQNFEDDYHIYEMDVDGKNLRQLTFASGVFDIDPLYLPDGDIVFTSSREPKYCMCNRHIMGNLFRMESNGANVHQIGKNTLFEGHTTLMPDGRLLYDRWEYVDRNFGDAQGLWTVHPDGTNHAIYWGNNTPSPGAVIDGRMIPDTLLCLAIFGSCHDRPWGSLAIIDRRKGVDGKAPVVRTWPREAINQVGVGNWDAFKTIWPKYEDPYPLSKDTFLVTRTLKEGGAEGEGEQTGIYLLDTVGREVLLHTEKPGCFDPMPIAPRTRPPIHPVQRNYAAEPGTFYVVDVYRGPYMATVKRGAVKYLRVVESPEKRTFTAGSWKGQGAQAPGMNWLNFENKRILGIVPVEVDGSAYFEVPSDRFVFFQLLDEDRKLVCSMRSGANIQSGEVRGCVGCHDTGTAGVPARTHLPLALLREPSVLDGWQGSQRMFSYMSEVQPVFDKHCVSCHDYGREAGEVVNLAPDRTLVFNTSYTALWSDGWIDCVGAGPAEIQAAYSWGSHASKLTATLEPSHYNVRLSADERDRVITWMDINAPYYPVYESAYPENPAGRSPLDKHQVERLEELICAKFVLKHGDGLRAQISFDRPGGYPCGGRHACS
jgi:hypothetical protein